MDAVRYRSQTLIYIALLALALMPFAPAALRTEAQAEGPQTSAAFTALWSNDFTRAKQLFERALDDDRDDQSARRGLVLSALALGDDDLALEELEYFTSELRILGTYPAAIKR